MNVFILEQITLEDLNYPVRETGTSTWGIYSSLDKAYEALQTLVAEENKKYTLGYIVTETRLDNWATLEVSIHTYTRTGELNDEQIISDEEHPDCDKPFYGRPKEKIRFKPGDIVEVWQCGTSELHIVCALPWTPQEVEKRNKRLVEEYGEGHELRLDSIDDCYLVYSLGIGDTHGHSQAAYLFAPTQKVPAKIRLKLQAKLIEENFTAGHNLQMSELPFAKDPKVLNEVLNIWEKVAKTKDYDEINCLLIRDKADWIKSQLDFSPKQAQRFDRFYTKCKKLLKEKKERGSILTTKSTNTMGVFELNRICLETLRYPSRKVRVTELGLYSTFENAYEKLQELVVESKKEKEECEKEGDKDYAYAFTFGYSIHEKQLDILYGDTISVRTYTRDGTLNDECIWKDEKGTDLLPFYGRPKEKIRFKAGDIVEVFMYGNVELSIISSLPWTPQEIEKRNKKLEEKHGKGYTLTLDSTDDCYLAHSLGLGNTHFHPSCTDIFAPLKKIPATIRRKLQAKLLEESFTFGYSLQISELPFSKDAKVLDELLNGWDKFIEAKYYTGMECLVDYGNPDNIKAQLDFSKEQSQRFEHFFDVCVRLVNEKRKNV